MNMIPQLNEVIGLPPATPVVELGRAAERRYESLFDGASHGDANAQRELVELRVAHLNWVYSGTEEPMAESRLPRQSWW